MIYKEERKIFIGGTVSAVTNNVSVNVHKHQKPPHSFAVADRQTVRIVGTEDTADAAVSSQICLDTKSDITQVKPYGLMPLKLAISCDQENKYKYRSMHRYIVGVFAHNNNRYVGGY